MRARARLIATAALTAALGVGAGLMAAAPATAGPAASGVSATSAGAQDVAPAASWTYYGSYSSSRQCALMALALRQKGTADDTKCEFYPGTQHVWKLYYR